MQASRLATFEQDAHQQRQCVEVAAVEFDGRTVPSQLPIIGVENEAVEVESGGGHDFSISSAVAHESSLIGSIFGTPNAHQAEPINATNAVSIRALS